MSINFTESYIKFILLNEIGTYFEEFGGYLAGCIDTRDTNSNGLRYLLIVGPKEYCELKKQLAWKLEETKTNNTNSLWNGYKNTLNMINNNISHPAAEFCHNINYNEFNDYYLPAKNELNLLYRQFKPTADRNYIKYEFNNINQTTISAFVNEEILNHSNYWSSSEGSNPSSWTQSFRTGYQYRGKKICKYDVRAVRRVIF